jgi:hypothetical protein
MQARGTESRSHSAHLPMDPTYTGRHGVGVSVPGQAHQGLGKVALTKQQKALEGSEMGRERQWAAHLGKESRRGVPREHVHRRCQGRARRRQGSRVHCMNHTSTHTHTARVR